MPAALAGPRGHLLRGAHQHRAQDQAVGPGAFQLGQVRRGADAASHLQPHPGAEGRADAADGLAVPRRAGPRPARGIQVHHVHPARPGAREAQRHRGRVLRVAPGRVVAALTQAHAGPAQQVDGRQDEHGAQAGTL